MILKTTYKIGLARLASAVIVKMRRVFGLSETILVTRQGIRWSVDPREGFDLSIYLLGSVEPAVIRTYPQIIKEGDVVLDVGANIGGHSLHFARLTGPKGLVIAVEPSDWAIAKLKANLDLNPELSRVIRVRQFFLGPEAGAGIPDSKEEVYSSWPLGRSENLHEKHFGRKTTVTEAGVATLDSLVDAEQLSRVDIIKLDVDGAEWKILKGAQKTLEKHRPLIIMELAPYLFEQTEFDDMIAFLRKFPYVFYEVGRGLPYPNDPGLIRKRIPEGATGNVVLRPGEKADLASPQSLR